MTFSANPGHLDFLFRLVVSAPACSAGVQIVVDPEAKSLERRAKLHRRSVRTQQVVAIVTHNKAVTLEIALREHQYAVGDFTDLFLQF